MPQGNSDLEQFWQEVNAEVSARRFLVFPGALSLQGVSATWPVKEGIAGFLDLAVSLGVRIVYMKGHSLSESSLIDTVATFLSDIPEAVDADTAEAFLDLAGVGSEPEAEQYLRQGEEHLGQLESVHVGWVHDGVAHRLERHAGWYGALMDRAAEVADLIEQKGPA
jgi:hypothetical protein